MNEPFWWGLFSAGGTLAAFVVPVMILVTAFITPLGGAHHSLSYAHARALLDVLVVKIGLTLFVSLSLFHCAHRIRHALLDTGLVHSGTRVAAICYLAATAASAWCGMALR